MGMIGNYIAFESSLLESIISGEKDILDLDPDRYNPLDIDKSWHAISYLLSRDTHGGEPPAGYVVPIREENMLNCELEFGAFYLTAQQVREASDYLNSLDDDTLFSMYDFEAMRKNRIYPIWDNDTADGFYEYIQVHLEELKKYFKQMSEKEYAIVFYID